MKFKFNISLNDKDYYEFSKFNSFKSQFGKRGILYMRLFAVILFVGLTISSVIKEATTGHLISGIIVEIIFLAIILLLMRPIMCVFLKLSVKIAKKSAKKLYSPSSVMGFYDDEFTEETSDNLATYKYSAIERAYVTDKMIYIYINNMAAYIIPISAIGSDEKCNEFIDFLKSKGIQVS